MSDASHLPTLRKLLVTGAAGFIGFHLCNRLLDLGFEVEGLDNMNLYYEPALKQARLALLREMSSIDIAFFDEPTTNLDEARREALARQILNVRGFRQLFVISHDDTFEQATQNLIRVERVDGASRVMVS